MDLEGFSGMDGRSSIFDYWGLKSLQAWTNNGKFDGKMLSEEQKDLRKFYQKLLTVARDNKAINSGLMYDLEYAQGEDFNKHEQYAFVRKYEKQILLMVMNFDDRQVDVDVRIPKEAFEYLKQDEWEKASAVDLLTNTAYKSMPLTSQQPIHLTLPAWKGVILEFKKSTPKKCK